MPKLRGLHLDLLPPLHAPRASLSWNNRELFPLSHFASIHCQVTALSRSFLLYRAVSWIPSSLLETFKQRDYTLFSFR